MLVSIQISGIGQHYQFAWQNCFGGTGADRAYGVAQTENGFIIAGSTDSMDGDITIDHGGIDGWLVRTDQNGGLIWQKSYGGTNGDYLKDVFSTAGGNFLLAGMTASQNGTIDHNPYPGTWSYWFMKVDGEGNIIWQTIAGGPNTNWLWGAYPTADGGIIGIGETVGGGGDISHFFGYVDIWVVKLDANGQVEWDFTAGTPTNVAFGIQYGLSVIQTSDEGYLLTGQGTVGLHGNLDCEPTHSAAGIIVKLDANGQQQWSRCFGGDKSEVISDIVEVDDGYVFTGSVRSKDGAFAGCIWSNNDVSDLWIGKIDFDGDLLWMHCYGGTRDESGSTIKLRPDGGFTVLGSAGSHDGDVTHNYAVPPRSNLWVLRFTAEGLLLYEACFGSKGITYSGTRNNMLQLGSNRLVIVGYTTAKAHQPPENTGNIECGNYNTGYANLDWWAFEIYDTTVFVQEHFDLEKIQVFPNPAVAEVWVQLPEKFLIAGTKIELYNPMGSLLYKAQLQNNYHRIDISHLPKGLYLLRIWNGKSWFIEKVVVR